MYLISQTVDKVGFRIAILLQSRYYDTEIKRFINADDVSVIEEDKGSIVEHNLFAYCLNNPVNMLDNFEKSAALAVTFGGKIAY